MENKDLSIETVTINGQKHIVLRASQALREAVALQAIKKAEKELAEAKLSKSIISPKIKTGIETVVVHGEKKVVLRLSPQDKETVALYALQKANNELIEAKLNGAKGLIIPGTDEKAAWHHWGIAKIEDLATYTGTQEPTIHAKNIVSQKDLLTALADAHVGSSNLSSIWENNLSKLLGEKDSKEDPALDIAEGQSSTGLALTTLQAVAEEKVVPVHIILNKNTEKGLVVGEGALPFSLSAAFNKAGLAYIDRNNKAAPTKIEAALDQLISTATTSKYLKHGTMKGFLRDAFAYRNVAPDTTPLPELLADKTIEPNFTKFVIKNKPAV